MNKNLKYIIGVISFFILYLVLSINIYSAFGISLFIYSGTKFFIDLGNKIEIKDIIILLALLQWVIGPFFAYNFFYDDEFYYMAVEQNTYMGFVAPASLALILGLHLPIGKKNSNERIYLHQISNLLKKHKNLDILFIVTGVILSIVKDSFPISLRFFIFLLSGLRFVGLFLLLVGNRKNKWLIVGGVLFMLLLTALREAMFHDLLLWLSFFMMIASFIYKPSNQKKLIFLVAFLFLIVSIQTIKHSFREALSEGKGKGVSLFTDLVQEKVIESDYVTSETNLSAMVTRINQGWIISRIMYHTPRYEPFAGGETIKEALKSSLLPRFLAPNKVKAGGRTYFTRFTGKRISDNTSMGLSLLGEAYANFGIGGGIFFMFIIGLFYNYFIFFIYKIAVKHPAIIFFIPLIFLQVVKAEIDFSVILNHLVKASVAVWMIFWGVKNVFGVKI